MTEVGQRKFRTYETMSKRILKPQKLQKRSGKDVLRRKAQLFIALGDETRLQLLFKLKTGHSQSIKQLAEGLPVTRQAVTKHLRVLEEASFVTQEARGRERHFAACPAGIEAVRSALDLIAQQWDDALQRLKSFAEKLP